ncbi:Uncharacterized protein PHSC3_000868 [Chlamydiales bacterium STE3]|nr:Uncharacterized protein PHSC3_000868 [Chlamydiales bacterium STE3]
MNRSIVIKNSFLSVSETIDKITAILASKEATLFAVIDHSEEAKIAHLELAEERLIIFGNPKVGTALMQENPLIGLELPLKILVWHDEEKGTQVAYLDPLFLEKAYGITKNSETLKNMSKALHQLTSTLEE